MSDKPKAIVFDVDDTLTNNTERERFATDHTGPKQDGHGKNEAWTDMFQDGRLYHLDEPISPGLDIMGKLSDREYAILIVTGRRKGEEMYFLNWWTEHAYTFINTRSISFRPRGHETSRWKLGEIQRLQQRFSIIAGYGNEPDIPIYEECGFEAILVDKAGNGWRMPDQQRELTT